LFLFFIIYYAIICLPIYIIISHIGSLQQILQHYFDSCSEASDTEKCSYMQLYVTCWHLSNRKYNINKTCQLFV